MLKRTLTVFRLFPQVCYLPKNYFKIICACVHGCVLISLVDLQYDVASSDLHLSDEQIEGSVPLLAGMASYIIIINVL